MLTNEILQEKYLNFFKYLNNYEIPYFYNDKNYIVIQESITIGDLLYNNDIDNHTIVFPDRIIFEEDLILSNGYDYQFGNKTIIKGDFISKLNKLKNLGNFIFMGKNLHLDLSYIKLNNILINKNTNKRVDINFYNCNGDDKQISIPENFLNNKNNIYIFINAPSVLVENSYMFYSENNENNKIKIKFMNMSKINVINYLAPTSLHSKLLLNNIFNITDDEKKYFKENKEKLENYLFYDKNNIIYYCRTEKAMNFLGENNYSFTKKEYDLIKDQSIKIFYENVMIKQNIKKDYNNIIDNNKNNVFQIKNIM